MEEIFKCMECHWWDKGVCVLSGAIDVAPQSIDGESNACESFDLVTD